jgi:hypothetical protein
MGMRDGTYSTARPSQRHEYVDLSADSYANADFAEYAHRSTVVLSTGPLFFHGAS